MSWTEIVSTFVILWAVIDPVGTVPVFIAVTRQHPEWTRNGIARNAVLVAGGVLIFFICLGELILDAMGVSLFAFQIAGGIVLFLFALDMVFGSSKPDDEIAIVSDGRETAIFPLAVPSIASPGAMMAVVLLTDNHRFSIAHQLLTGVVMIVILAITFLFLMLSGRIHKLIGDAGASIISRVMGMLLSAVAVNSILQGIRGYFVLGS